MTYSNFINEEYDDWSDLTDPKTTDVAPVTTDSMAASDNTLSSAPSLGFGGKAVRDAALNLVRDPNFLIPAGAAALGAGVLFRTGQRIANVGSDEKKKRGPISRAFRTLLPLGLTGAGAYGAYKLMKPVSENANPYQSAFKPSAILPTAAGTAAAISAFPLADVITSGMKEGPLKTVSNIGAKALLSTLGTAGAGYVGYEAGKAIERSQEKKRQQEMQDRNQFLPDFYYDNVG